MKNFLFAITLTLFAGCATDYVHHPVTGQAALNAYYKSQSDAYRTLAAYYARDNSYVPTFPKPEPEPQPEIIIAEPPPIPTHSFGYIGNRPFSATTSPDGGFTFGTIGNTPFQFLNN